MEPLQIPLQGLGLIEASAGTGKTYTITALYLRLLLEQGLPVEQILVVTFTKAATAELKEKIRQRMVEARTAFQQGASEDALLQDLIEASDDLAQAERLLNCAILSFDRAAIYTIHGFCQRALADHAFESGQPFERELEPDQSALIQQVVDDFWRRELCDASAGFTRYLVEKKITPEKLLEPIKQSLNKPLLQVLGRERHQASTSSEPELISNWQSIRATWASSADEVMAQFQLGILNKGSYPPEKWPEWQQQMSQLLQSESLPTSLFAKFNNFSSETLSARTNKNKQIPTHTFFDLCQQFWQGFQQLQQDYAEHLIVLQCSLRRYLLQELPKRRAERHIQAHDDLLLDLLKALEQPDDALAAALRQRYRAALIDEFQDTDPVQCRIFSLIYDGSDQPLFYVGDPKQAIYSFRSADIFSYLKARQSAKQIHTLDTNWRSVPGLINSVNRLFSAQHSFLLEGIRYSDVHPAPKEREVLIDENGGEEPFCFQLIESGEKPLSKAVATEIAANGTAEAITRLLNQGQTGAAKIGEEPLSGGHIAVLVRSHTQAQLISEKLLQRGIFSVQNSSASVYESAQALALERLLLAIAEPGREPLLKAALATEMLGYDASALARLMQDERLLDEQIEQFNDYHRLWRESGFVTLFRHLLKQRSVASRLLGFADGERRLTNLLHLGELIQQQEQQHRPGMRGLINWLNQQRREPPQQNEAAQLRLESDENLVQILTIHKSKGLQFPIVFCPFLWDGRLHTSDKNKCATFTFHDPGQEHEALLELGSEQMEQNRPLAVREEMAENLRLLYVALTRAQYRCTVSWGNIKSAETSALAWLLHPPTEPEGPGAIDQMAAAFKKLDDEGIARRLADLASELPGDLRVDLELGEGSRRYSGEGRNGEVLTARSFPRQIFSSRRLTSFSALTAGIESDLPDYDAHTSEMLSQRGQPPCDIFSFPRGARAGSSLHDIFEHLDFTQAEPAVLAPLVETSLQGYGFSSDWQPVISNMVSQVLDTPLDGDNLRLREIAKVQRLNELEFCFPLSALSGHALQRVLIDHGFGQHQVLEQAIRRLDFKHIQGFLKGFIDLIFEADGRFYLVDYKSNWLGDRPEDYGLEAMREAIAEHSYYLQYLLYVVALHRYLRSRLPDYDYERHFGQVFYLFLRGMQPGGGDTGIYRDRPSRELIEALDRLFQEGADG